MQVILCRHIGSILEPSSVENTVKAVKEINKEYDKVVDETTDEIKLMNDADGALLFYVDVEPSDTVNIHDAVIKMHFILDSIKED